MRVEVLVAAVVDDNIKGIGFVFLFQELVEGVVGGVVDDLVFHEYTSF